MPDEFTFTTKQVTVVITAIVLAVMFGIAKFTTLFDSRLNVEDLPVQIALRMMDENLKLNNVSLEQVKNRQNVINTLQQVILTKLAAQDALNNETQRRLQRQENRDN